MSVSIKVPVKVPVKVPIKVPIKVLIFIQVKEIATGTFTKSEPLRKIFLKILTIEFDHN